jgi:hypothetical protein
LPVGFFFNRKPTGKANALPVGFFLIENLQARQTLYL